MSVPETKLVNVVAFLTTTVDGHTRLNPEAVKDLLLIAHYRVASLSKIGELWVSVQVLIVLITSRECGRSSSKGWEC